jgi:hypothetical protein
MAFFVTGCSPEKLSVQDQAFFQMYPDVRMNKELELKYINVQNVNSGKIEDGVVFEIKNYAKDQILTSYENNTKILSFDSAAKQWKTIKNLAESYSGEDVFIPFYDNNEPPCLLSFLPEIDPSLDKISLRVVITGTIYRNNAATHEKVGAYIDFELVK